MADEFKDTPPPQGDYMLMGQCKSNCCPLDLHGVQVVDELPTDKFGVGGRDGL